MDVQAAGAGADRKLAPVYLIFTGEILLGAPKDVAWSRIINYPSWQNYTIVQTVSGAPGQEGEVVFLQKEEIDIPPYYARTVKLDAPNRVIWKVFQAPGADIDTFGFVEFNLFEAQEKTRFCYNCLYEFEVPHSSEPQAFRDEKYQQYDAALSVMWAKLKKMVG